MKKTILLVENEESIRSVVNHALLEANYSVVTASDELSALNAVHQSQPDIAVLDSECQTINEIELCRKIRSVSDTAVILMNGESSEFSQLDAYANGALDYITHPASTRVLTARIGAMMQRLGNRDSESQKFVVGPLELDSFRHIFKVNGVEVPLTKTEFELLRILISSPEQTITHNHLIKSIWGEWFSSTHMIESHISRLRSKIRDNGGPYICEAVRGVGYRLGVKV